MGITGFLAALHGLRTSLHAPDVIRHEDDLTVVLPYEAGRRFEAWFKHNAPPHMPVFAMIKDGIEPKPIRSVTIDGVKIAWPLYR